MNTYRALPCVPYYLYCVAAVVIAGTGRLAQAEDLELVFSKARAVGEHARLADVDGDSRVDLISLDSANVLRVSMNGRDGFVDALPTQLPPYSFLEGISDLDGDGFPDLLIVTANHHDCSSNSLSVYWNSGNSNDPYPVALRQALPLPPSPFCVHASTIDFDGDGDDDIILTNMPFANGGPYRPSRTYRNVGGREFQVASDFVWPRDLLYPSTVDIDGDGKVDFLSKFKHGWADGLWGTYLYRGNGDGTFGPAVRNFQSERSAGGFTIDLNGVLNPGVGVAIYAGQTYSGTLHIGQWNPAVGGLAFSPIEIPSPYVGRQGVDVDRDGIEDIVLTSTAVDGLLGYMKGIGNGVFSSVPTPVMALPGFEFAEVAFEASDSGPMYAIAMSSLSIAVFRTHCGTAGGADIDGNGVPDECQTVMVPLTYPTIQAAIDAAPVDELRIVQVYPGTYNEALDFQGKPVIVRGAGAGKTVLDGTGARGISVVRFSGGEPAIAALEGVTVRGGLTGTPFPGAPQFLCGGGLFAFNSGASVRDCVFEQNIASFGAGAYVWQSTGSFERCEFRNNNAGTDGGGAQLYRGSVRMVDCVVNNNFANSRGGGLHVVDGVQTLMGTAVTNNRCGNLVGGVSWVPAGNPSARLVLEDCTVTGNSAQVTQGGIGILSDGGGVKISLEGSTVCSNLPRPNIFGQWIDLGENNVCDCPGDVTGDGIVNGVDLGVLLGQWGLCPSTSCVCDLDSSGIVDGADLGMLLGDWGACD